MKPEIKAKWVEALRSGKYKQGKSCLYDSKTDSYCCLGVLTDIRRKEVKKGKDYLGGGYLQNSVQKWAGLDTHDPIIDPQRSNCCSASDSNDILGLGFIAIADLIEKNL